MEDQGGCFVTETEKEVARVHEIPAEFLNMLWNQHEAATLARTGLALDLTGRTISAGQRVAAPKLPLLLTRKSPATQEPRWISGLGSTRWRRAGGWCAAR